MENNHALLLMPFANGGSDKKLICGNCRSPQPMGVVSEDYIHYRRKGWGEFWVSAEGFRSICESCGASCYISWKYIENTA
jgi:hypothetical protein